MESYLFDIQKIRISTLHYYWFD